MRVGIHLTAPDWAGCEALIWIDGHPAQGLTGNADGHQARKSFPITTPTATLWLEVACNGMFGVGRDGMINAPDPTRYCWAPGCCCICLHSIDHWK